MVTLGVRLTAAQGSADADISLSGNDTYSVESSSRPQSTELQADIELRKSLGFRSDDGYVNEVRASSKSVYNERFSRILLTVAESNELTIRMDLDEDIATLQQYFEQNSEIRGALGGVYI